MHFTCNFTLEIGKLCHILMEFQLFFHEKSLQILEFTIVDKKADYPYTLLKLIQFHILPPGR